jgi:hypothetical protein
MSSNAIKQSPQHQQQLIIAEAGIGQSCAGKKFYSIMIFN